MDNKEATAEPQSPEQPDNGDSPPPSVATLAPPDIGPGLDPSLSQFLERTHKIQSTLQLRDILIIV